MINDNKEEIKLIADIIARNMIPSDPLVLKVLVNDAIYEAISTSGDVDNAIKYIITTHPILSSSLKEVIKEHYSDKLADIEKLIILT